MRSSTISASELALPSGAASERYTRLAQTATFRAGGFDPWQSATIGIIGVGVLGGPLAIGVVRSGASVAVCDFDIGESSNLGTQPVEVGVPKVESVVAACDAIRPGQARAFQCDIRHVGVGTLAQLDLIVDCSDDPNLALPLAEISNGVGVPMLRCAVDGSGVMELGRVSCSSGETGHACSICSYRLDDLGGGQPRSGCPGPVPPSRPATIAGSALGMVISGMGLLAAQRIITGNDAKLVLGRETIMDLNNMQTLAIELPRSEHCLSGHRRWDLRRLDLAASTATLADVYRAAAERLGTAVDSVEPYLHPLFVRADCACGRLADVVGTRWAVPPVCWHCGQAMSWQRVIQVAKLAETDAAELGILNTPLRQLGLPSQGAMIVARATDRPPLRLVLSTEPVSMHAA